MAGSHKALSGHRIDLTTTRFAFGCRPLAVANVFFRSGENETWGRGIQRIFTACKEAGIPRPSLTFDGTGLALEFRYSPEYLKAMPAAEPSRGGQVTPEVTPEVRRLLSAFTGEHSRRELQEQLGLQDDDHMRIAYIVAALATGLIEMTIPAKPNSRLQKYRLTAKGRGSLGYTSRA